MLTVTLNDTSDDPWSLKGWTVEYKRIGAKTYSWRLIDPIGTTHGDPTYSDLFYREYNVTSLEHLFEKVGNSAGAQRAIEKYLSGNAKVHSQKIG